jgi:hypothetical protein
MDLTNIKSAVLSELSGKKGLQSLKLQNHIYGCFLIMEDIAQGNVTFINNGISTPKFSLDLDKQFSAIGIRYGFVMDTKLSLNNYNQDYKDNWLKCFNDISIQKNIDEVDKIEDTIIEVIQGSISEDDAFFLNALDTGTLPQEWLEKVLVLLTEPTLTKSDSEEDLKKTAISQAVTEKPANIKNKRLASTRRANSKQYIGVKRNFTN